MKIALVHELLTMRGGAERMLKVLADMFSEAPIYILLYNEKKLGDWFPANRVITSNVQSARYPLPADRSFNHHLYLSRFPSAVESWDFSQYDLVLSSSSAFAHGIITNGKPKHLSYIQSPARYLWDRTHDVINHASKGILGPLKGRYLERKFHKLRMWDSEAAHRPDVLIAASKEVQRRIELYWRRQSQVIYPPIDDVWLDTANSGQKTAGSKKDSDRYALTADRSYYFLASTLVPYKRIDLAIAACNALKRPLKIAGEGSDYKRLKKLAGPTIEFLGYVPHSDLKNLYTNARATIFPGEEDFGLVPLESMSCGTPVIAYGKGGALETVIEGQTGEFFGGSNQESLQEVMEKFEQKKYSEDVCAHRAKEFSRSKFEEGIRTLIAHSSSIR